MLWIFVLLALILVVLISFINAISFPRLGRRKRRSSSCIYDSAKIPPFVSVLIPVRDEASNIRFTLERLLAQNYPAFEIVVLDDQSEDNTPQIVKQLAVRDPCVQMIQGEPVPEGWTGKNWASQQLSLKAQGEILVFTDADVTWNPDALTNLVRCMEDYQADVLTVWPTQFSKTWSERLIVPMMTFSIIGYLPELLVRNTPWPVFSAAIGQALAFRRAAYFQIGGNEAVRAQIVEDIALGWLVKSKGFRLVEALGNKSITTRMYTNWNEVRDGFAKLFVAGHHGQPLLVVLTGVIHWLIFLFPWIWLLLGFFMESSILWPALPAAMAALGVGARALCAAVAGERVSDSILLPVSVLIMTVIVGKALWWHYRYGGPLWKGRLVQARIKSNG